LNLDIGFPVDTLRQPVRDLLAGRAQQAQVVRAAINRRGRAIECTVNVSGLMGDQETKGVILMMDAVPRDAAAPAQQAEKHEDVYVPTAASSDGDGQHASTGDGKATSAKETSDVPTTRTRGRRADRA